MHVRAAIAAIGLAAALAAGTAVTASSASANTDPSDSPTGCAKPYPAAPCVIPTGTPTGTPTIAPPIVRQRPEQFQLQLTDSGLNLVRAQGPVTFFFAHDTELTPNLGVFAGGFGSVFVHHQALSVPVINPFLCDAVINQTGTWSFTGRSGLYAHATGHGLYGLQLTADYAINPVTGACSIAGVSPLTVRNWLQFNTGPHPRSVTLDVTGVGTASR